MYSFPRSLTGIFCLVLSLSYGCWQTNAAAAHRTIDESDIGEARWTVKAKPDGPDLHLNGTVQQVYSQLLSINPNYDRDWNISIPTIRDERDADRIVEEIATEIGLIHSKPHHKRSLVQRSYHGGYADDDADWLSFWHDSVLNIQCTLNEAKRAAIVEGVAYLRWMVKGRAYLDPIAQKSCSRVSCSRDSGIIWCVHGSFSPTRLRGGEEPGYAKGFKPVELESYSTIGGAAMALFDYCHQPGKYISGRVFTRDDWYVSVERQDC